MRKNSSFLKVLALVFVLLSAAEISAQTVFDPKIFTVFAGKGTVVPQDSALNSVTIGRAVTIGGPVAAKNKILTGDSVFVSGAHYAGSRVHLGDYNTANFGVIAMNNPPFPVGNLIFKAGLDLTVGDVSIVPPQYEGIIVNGDITIASGSLQAFVRRPASSTYAGPSPAGGTDLVTTFPDYSFSELPVATTVSTASTIDITSSTTISPGTYDDMTLSGGQQIVFTQPGVYVFRSINNSGSNTFRFNWQLNPTGIFKIYVIEEANFGNIQTQVYDINGAPAYGDGSHHIYFEVQGDGNSNFGKAVTIGDTLNSSVVVNWMGTVYAPNGNIRIHSGGPSAIHEVHGAFWSGTNVFVGDYINLLGSVLATEPEPYTPARRSLKLKDFVIWGGSSSPQTFDSTKSVTLLPGTAVSNNGYVGSNHLVENPGHGLSMTGSIFSGNKVRLGNMLAVTGNVTANNMASAPGYAMTLGEGQNILTPGNVAANGSITQLIGFPSVIQGKLFVPDPRTDYTGMIPDRGKYSSVGMEDSLFPVMPVMPVNNSFTAGVSNVTGAQTITPGRYGSLSLNSGDTLRFSGTGTYVFSNILLPNDESKFIFDFQSDFTGMINILVTGDFKAKVSCDIVNGGPGASSRIYTEVHGNGSVNSGRAFDLAAQPPFFSATAGSNWVGTVWAPNGSIYIESGGGSNAGTNVTGALWSAHSVVVTGGTITYSAPAMDLNFIEPFIASPDSGKVSDKIGSELTALYTDSTATMPDTTVFQVFVENNSRKVVIEVIAKEGQSDSVIAYLLSTGFSIITYQADKLVITGKYPVSNLLNLNTIDDIDYVRPMYKPMNNAGAIMSQGDGTMKTDKVRNHFGLDGDGIKIGVISDSYNNLGGAPHDVDEGELPGDPDNRTNVNQVQVLRDYYGERTDEGRAMLQIVHDIAPKALLAFRTGYISAVDFARGIIELANVNCDVIVDDLTYITEPFFRDGVVAKAVDSVVNTMGVTYLTSAGNFGGRSFQSQFAPVSAANVPNLPSIIPTGVYVHNFGSGTYYQTVTLKPGTYRVVLQWEDDFYSLGGNNGAANDFDMYLLNDNGLPIAGFNRDNQIGDPLEILPFIVREETVARVMIVRASGSGTPRFKYVIFGGNATINSVTTITTDNSTIVGHANSASAITVGAMLYDNPNNIDEYPLHTLPSNFVYPSVASFSSRGGTQIIGESSPRVKPEIVAPNGVNTSVNMHGDDIEGDEMHNFYGTSAAAPHAAAVAALIIQAKKKFDLYTQVAPAEVRYILQSTAQPMAGQSGVNYESGYGYIQADKTILTIANAKPIIIQLTGTPSTESFPFTVESEYLTSQTQIIFNGSALATTVSPDGKMASAIAPGIPLNTNPPVQLLTPDKSPSHLDGGLSDPAFFYGDRRNVVVRVVDTNKKFGQANPSFSVEVTVDDTLISELSQPLTLADLKLEGNNLTFTTKATTLSDVNTYTVKVERTSPLSQSDPIDSVLMFKYKFTFVNGRLAINKLPLHITPKNKTLIYGQDIGIVSYDYNFGTASVTSDVQHFVDSVHRKYIADNAIAVINGVPATTTVMDNMALLASYQSLNTARKYTVNNGQLMAMVNNDDEFTQQRFFIDVPAQSLTNYALNASQAEMVAVATTSRALLSARSLADGTAKAGFPNGQLMAMVNGQLMAMVNGQLMAMVNGQLMAMVNVGDPYINVSDIVLHNGQLMAMVNGSWVPVVNGQLMAMVNGVSVTVQFTVQNGELTATVNGVLMAMVNGQLMAMVNGQLMAMVNGQLMAMVNGNLLPLMNGQLMAMVNGQLMAMVNGSSEEADHLVVHNGQLMAMVNGEWQVATSATFTNSGGIQVNYSVSTNGQLMAMVNGVSQPTVNGQLMAMVNGQLMAMVNGELVLVDYVQEVNGQLMAMVNGQLMAMVNGQLMAMVNGQLMAMVNGQLMAMVNTGSGDRLTFAMFVNGQLMAMVNGQLMAMVNGQLMAMVNGELVQVSNYSIDPSTNEGSVTLANGQLMAMVNGQLMAMVNGVPTALVNNNALINSTNNSNTAVIIDANDLGVQHGIIGGMLGVNMITGLDAGVQKLIPAAFLHSNFEVTYGQGEVVINPAILTVSVADTSRNYGEANPAFTATGSGLKYDQLLSGVVTPSITTLATEASPVGTYPIAVSGGTAPNYFITYSEGTLTVKPATLTIKPDDLSRTYGQANPPLTYTVSGFVNGETVSVMTAPVLATTATVSSPVGTYDITFTGGAAQNYSFALDTGTLTITKASLGIKADDLAKVYGETNPALTMTATGFVNGDDMSDISAPSISTTADITSPVGNYVISLAGGSADNYDLTLTNGTLQVSKAVLQVAANNTTKVYGEANPPLTFSTTGFVNGDDPGDITAPLITTTAAQGSPVGDYPIELSGGSAANYIIQLQNGILTVNKAQLIVKADDRTKTYGESNPSLTMTVTGYVNGDDVGDIVVPSITTAATASSAAGDYPIVLSGGTASNYSLTLENGVLTILKAPLLIKADDLWKTEGQANPPLTMTATGFVNGDNMGSIVAPTATTTASSTSPAGTYTIVLTGGSAANYMITLQNGVLTIVPSTATALSITADTKFIHQGDPLPVFTSTIVGLNNNDVISGISYSASSVNTSVAGEYTNMPSVNTAAYPQYQITFNPGKFYVNPYGPNAKKVIVKRECVRPLSPAVRGFGYMALFTYTNPNPTPVYIPHGTDNLLTIATGGSFEANLPVVFQPGTHEVVILFSGHQMYWSVKSMDTYHKTAVTSDVNQTSARCDAIVVSKAAAPGKHVETSKMEVFPNPAGSKLTIRLTGNTITSSDVVVSDVIGKQHSIKAVVQENGATVHMDVSALPPGTYFVRLQSSTGFMTARFVKL